MQLRKKLPLVFPRPKGGEFDIMEYANDEESRLGFCKQVQRFEEVDKLRSVFVSSHLPTGSTLWVGLSQGSI